MKALGATITVEMENFDVETDIELNDYVSFRGEEVQGVKKAFFVKNVNKSMKYVKDVNNERRDN